VVVTMKIFFALIFLSVASILVSSTRDATEYLQLWTQFKQTHNKIYLTTEEESNRHSIFISNVDRIDQLNHDRNPRTYYAINQFTDMTRPEIMAYFNHPDFKAHHDRNSADRMGISADRLGISADSIPDAVDWREKGAVTPIGNQGQCGSSPYWSSIVSMEGAWAIAGHPLANLSVQQIIDCSSSLGNYGCGGGEMTYSFQYILNTGSETAEDYPYTGNDDSCHFNAQKIKAKFSSYKNIPEGDEAAFTEALAMVPVAAAVNAADNGFEFYQSGIYDSPTCDQTGPCHGIGVVGYGSNDQGEYYILKNTWGTTWGIKGYMLLARNKGNMCSIASYGSYIVV